MFVRDVPPDEIEDTETDELRDPNFGPDPPEFEGPNETGAPVIGALELNALGGSDHDLPAGRVDRDLALYQRDPGHAPIHVHLVEFQVLDRQQFNVDEFKATWMVDFIQPHHGQAISSDAPRPRRGECFQGRGSGFDGDSDADQNDI